MLDGPDPLLEAYLRAEEDPSMTPGEQLAADGVIPPVLRPREVVLVTGLPPDSIRHRLQSGKLRSYQGAAYETRLTPVREVDELCWSLGFEANWYALVGSL